MHTDNQSQGRNYFRENSMLCSRCGEWRETRNRRLNLSYYKIDGDINRIDCKVCNNFIAIKINEDLLKIDEVIEDDEKDFWQEAKTTKEKIIYYTLCKIIYPEFDSPNKTKYESVYDLADDSDLVMLRWKKGVPIAFYTLKRKGTIIPYINGQEEYLMPTLDTAYVRSEYRGHGIGTEILNNITEMFADEEIGFSAPISDGMSKVLKKFLNLHKNWRLKFWEIKNGGEDGSRKLVWFMVNKRNGSKEGKNGRT